MSSAIAARHVRELAERKSKLYGLQLTLDQNPSADEACCHSLARVVDRALFNEVSVDAAALSDLNALMASASGDLASTLAVLDAAFTKAEPERANLQLCLASFPAWIRAASDAARSHIMAMLPDIAPHLKDLKNPGVEALIRCLNQCASADQRDLVARSIVRYQETSGEIILAAAELAGMLLRTGAGAAIENMLSGVPPEEMFESKDARLLIPAVAKLRDTGIGDEAWSAAAVVCFTAAKEDRSSALNLCRELPGALAPLPIELRVVYLKAFGSIVEEAGISLLGYGSKQLPSLFRKMGAGDASAFVAEGAGIARRYGKIAAQEFFEQKTSASREAGSRQAVESA